MMRIRSRQKAERDLDRELAHHLHELTQAYLRQGYTREEAARLAHVDLGGPEQIREECRDERSFAWIIGLRQDVVFGLRMMRRTPIVTIAAVVSLALGIGANAAIVSLMNIVLWRDLPVPDARQLSLVHWQTSTSTRDLIDGGSGSMVRDGAARVADFFSFRAFQELRAKTRSSASIAAFQYGGTVSATYRGRPVVAQERPVSGNFFDTLQIRARLGRVITESDDTFAAPPVVVVSHRFWVRALASDQDAIGRTFTVNSKPHTIVGVLGPDFYGLSPGDGTDLYAPIHHGAWLDQRRELDLFQNDRFWSIQLVMRRNQDISAESMVPLVNTVFRSTWTRKPQNSELAPQIRLDDGSRGLGMLRREFRNPLLVLGALVAFLLLIACINIANLLLARAAARQREVATRIALGCGRLRLMRQFLTESALLALLGGLASIAVAYLTANLLGQFVVARESTPISVAPDASIMLAVGTITGITLFLFGLFPAWRTSAPAHPGSLRQEAGGLGFDSRKTARTGRALVFVQMAMSVVLVLAAVIFTRNLLRIDASDPGFDRHNLVLFTIRPGTSGYEKDRLTSLYRRIEERLQAIPGVQSVGVASFRPMNIGGWWSEVRLPGQSEKFNVNGNQITPGYLPVLNGSLVAGRNITQSDIDGRAKVAVISKDLAEKLGGLSVLGQTLEFADGPPGSAYPRFQIVGIAPVIAATSIKERPAVVWLPFVADEAKESTVILRTATAPSLVLPEVQRAMREIDHDLPLVDPFTMEQQIAKGLQRERMFATLCSGFGSLALTLSVVGLYGVLAYSISRRRGEIGLRLALGAMPGDVIRMVVREGLSVAVFGMIAAAPLVLFGARYLEKELFGINPLEPTSVTIALSLMLIAAAAAIAIPAVRASHLQPARTLKHE